MNLIYKDTINVEDYNSLREAVGWGKLIEDQAKQGLKHSAYIVSCYDEEKIAGTARIIWDKGYVAYLADVMVMPEYQGMGIGCRLVEKTLAFVESQLREGWKIKVVLIAAKEKEGFYRKFGFVERPNENNGAGMDLWLTK